MVVALLVRNVLVSRLVILVIWWYGVGIVGAFGSSYMTTNQVV